MNHSLTRRKSANLVALTRRLDWPDVKWPLPPKLRKAVDAALREQGMTVDWRKVRRNPNLVLQLALTVAALQLTHPELFPKD